MHVSFFGPAALAADLTLYSSHVRVDRFPRIAVQAQAYGIEANTALEIALEHTDDPTQTGHWQALRDTVGNPVVLTLQGANVGNVLYVQTFLTKGAPAPNTRPYIMTFLRLKLVQYDAGGGGTLPAGTYLIAAQLTK